MSSRTSASRPKAGGVTEGSASNGGQPAQAWQLPGGSAVDGRRKSLLAFLARRAGAALLVLFVVTLLTFVVLHLLPGDAAVLQLGLEASPEDLEQLRAATGSAGSAFVQYVDWLVQLLQGDWGTSSTYGTPVRAALATAIPVTLFVSLYATLIALLISSVLGIASALKPGSLVDMVARVVIQLASAAPGFLLAILFMLLFAASLHWLPTNGYTAPGENLGAWLASMTLPALTLAVGECGNLTRIIRSSTLSSLQRGYMFSTQVKGLRRFRAVVVYALRSALVAPLTMMGLQLAKLLSGAVIVERIFSLPGLGRLMITAVEQRDGMLLQGVVLVTTAAIIAVTLLADILVMYVDPSLSQTGADTDAAPRRAKKARADHLGRKNAAEGVPAHD